MGNLEPTAPFQDPAGDKEFASPTFEQADQVLKALGEGDCQDQPNTFLAKRKEENLFPLEALPEKLQEVIIATNKCLLFPKDFTGTAMLCAAATAIGNSYTVTVKDGWQEGAVIYAALVAPPGANKSHPLTFAYAPLAKHDDETYYRYAQERKSYDLVNPKSKKQKNSSPPGEELPEPVLQKILMSDFTIEALTKAHHNNPRGVSVIADELAGFYKNFNRYNTGSEEQFWLSAWSAKTVSVDRASQLPIRINRPFIPVIGTIQNKVLLELAAKGKSDNGFLDRFIFAMPKGIKKERWSEDSLHKSHMEQWTLQLSNLLELKLEMDEWGVPKPRELRFSSNAWEKLKTWQAHNTDLCNGVDSEGLKGVYTKLETYAIRFSLILQLMAWACSEAEKTAVEEKAVDGAILLVEYFRKTAKEVQRIVNKSPLDNLDQLKKQLYDQLPGGFTTGEGLKLAERIGVPERTFKEFITNETLFTRVQHGKYLKAE